MIFLYGLAFIGVLILLGRLLSYDPDKKVKGYIHKTIGNASCWCLKLSLDKPTTVYLYPDRIQFDDKESIPIQKVISISSFDREERRGMYKINNHHRGQMTITFDRKGSREMVVVMSPYVNSRNLYGDYVHFSREFEKLKNGLK